MEDEYDVLMKIHIRLIKISKQLDWVVGILMLLATTYIFRVLGII
jgi:hypothetical protein